ncbi:hypothetical protein GOBAR_DD31422 [Gossypium barbadense]|nr:hypothetical protein GOBAR_DD31422 [Gossypium barbadense]
MQFPAPSAAVAGAGGAANAMIDSLCHHLREVGEVGEYEAVIACIQQRRCHWNPVLHMQQYFSIAEVSYALQQVAWRCRQRHCDHGKVGGKDFKRSGFGFKGHRVEVAKEIQNSVLDTNGNSTVTAVSERNERGSEKYEELKLGGELGKVEDKGSVVTEALVDRRIEAIPSLLQDTIERLVDLQVITAKPDSCIIDVYNEGDHSPPRMWPPWFGNPTFVLFLTECDITFGRVIGVDHPGDFKGSLKLSLSPGSLLVMEGKSADFAKHALPSVRKHRMLVTFTKYQPKKSVADNQRPPSPSVSQSPQWGPPSSRSLNRFRHSAGTKHFAAIPTNGVLPAAAIQQQIPPANVVQPLFVPAPAIPFPAPVPILPGSTGWSAAAGQRHFPPHLPIPGTGVFLPPPGSNSSCQLLSTIATELNVPMETISPLENSNGSGKLTHHTTSSRGKCDGPSPKQGCNGSVDETGEGRAAMCLTSKPANAV